MSLDKVLFCLQLRCWNVLLKEGLCMVWAQCLVTEKRCSELVLKVWGDYIFNTKWLRQLLCQKKERKKNSLVNVFCHFGSEPCLIGGNGGRGSGGQGRGGHAVIVNGRHLHVLCMKYTCICAATTKARLAQHRSISCPSQGPCLS